MNWFTKHVRIGERIMSQIEELNAAVSALTNEVAKVASVVQPLLALPAQVTVLQTQVSDLTAQLAAQAPPDLAPATAAITQDVAALDAAIAPAV
jgi:hypothetical protein